MKLNVELDLSDPNKPPFLTTRTHEEFLAALERSRKGEFVIEYLERVTQRNGAWRLRVRWNQ